MTFAYSVDLNDTAGESAATDTALVADLKAALADWSQYLTGLGTLVVQLDISATTRASGGPSGMYQDGTTASGAAYEVPAAEYEFATGHHLAGYTSDITISLDPTYLADYLYLDPNPAAGDTVPANKIDAISVFRHEICHGLGINGYYDQSGSLLYGGAYETPFDTLISFAPGGNAYFSGAAAVKVNGGPVQLTTNSTAGENYYHLSNSPTDPNYTDLMNGQYFDYGQQYQISNLDLAMLSDIGAPVTSYLDGSPSVPCFAAGTRLATAEGEIAVEAVLPGMRLRTLSGDLRPVRWVGRRTIDLRRHANPDAVRPIRIAAHALAPGRPSRPLVVSPDHAVWLADALIPARCLLNGVTIAPQSGAALVQYFHVELDAHDIILADGAAVESYLDTGNRADFDAAGTVRRLHPRPAPRDWPAHAVAPLVTSGPALAAALRLVGGRAHALGVRPSWDPDLRIIADGRVIRPRLADNRIELHLPLATASLTLQSRRTVPRHLYPERSDARVLGVAVRALTLDGVAVARTDPALAEGWQAPEDGWRWTTGSAVLRPQRPVRSITLDLLALIAYLVPPPLAAASRHLAERAA